MVTRQSVGGGGPDHTTHQNVMIRLIITSNITSLTNILTHLTQLSRCPRFVLGNSPRSWGGSSGLAQRFRQAVKVLFKVVDKYFFSVPGEPGLDYPIFSSVQATDFSCSDLVMGGYYADPGQNCQSYHICLPDQANINTLHPVSFLCPNGTIFNQLIFVCDWW